MLSISIGGGEPVGLATCQEFEVGAVRAGDADIRGFVARVVLEVTILKHEPLAVRRPGRAEVKMIGMRGDEFAIRAFGVAGPNLIALRTGEVKGDAIVIGTDAETIWQTLAGAREGSRIAAIEIHAERLADFAARNLDEDAVVTDQSLRGVKNFGAIFGGDFGE